MLSDINQIMQDIWHGFLQLQLDACAPDQLQTQECFVGKIQIIGQSEQWQVVLSCGKAAAKAAAGAMFMSDPETIADDDIKETVAELTNMVGGNIKTLLPGHNSLSLPLVAADQSADPKAAAGAATILYIAGYEFNDSAVCVEVHKEK